MERGICRSAFFPPHQRRSACLIGERRVTPQTTEVCALPAPLVASLRPRQCGMRIRLQVQNESESEGS